MKIYSVIDSTSWCWSTTANEIARRLPQHNFVFTTRPTVREAQQCDLVWMRGYPYLFNHIRETGVPFIWGFTSGGDRAGDQFAKCGPFIRQSAGIVVQNEEGRQIMERAGMDRLWLIPNGVDTDRFCPGPPRSRFMVGMAANVNGERWINKGADVVVAACREAGLHLRMATKPKPGRESPAAEFDAGRVRHDDMPRFLQGLSVFCQPSTAEGCSNSIMEAMAAGLPCVICRESGYHGELCRDGREHPNGEVLFIPPHDQHAVLAALQFLALTPLAAARISANARRFALAHSWDSVAVQFNAAFEAAAGFAPAAIPPCRFHLVTAATASYADCLRTMIPTWCANSGAASITVISDGPVDGLPAGVSVREDLRPVSNWVQGCMAKADALSRFAHEWADGEKVVFLDADCAVLRDLGPLADSYDDLTLTRFSPDANDHPKCAGTCSSGAIVFTASPRTRTFLQLWSQIQRAYADAGHGVSSGKVACDQYALTDLARGRACGITVRAVDEHVWNNAPDRSDPAWIADLQAHDSAVAHFKGGRWKNLDLVSKIVGNR